MMTKGRDYFESTGDGDGGMIVLMPRRVIWDPSVEEAAELPQTDDTAALNEIYERFCEGNEWLRLVPVEGALALRMGEGPYSVFWLPRADGALAVQWQGADSEEQLLSFALNHAGTDAWDEEIIFDAGDGQFYFCECAEALLGTGDRPLCEVSLPPGECRVTAKWVEDESVMAILFKFTRIS